MAALNDIVDESFTEKIKKYLNKKNVRYFSAEAIGCIVSYTALAGVTYTFHQSDTSNEINALASFAVKSTSFYAANIASFLALNYEGYKKEKRDPRKDAKDLTDSNIHGIGASSLLRIMGHYSLLELGVNHFLAPLVYPIPGTVGFLYKVWKNHKKGIIGKTD